jgi:hypothetical protein
LFSPFPNNDPCNGETSKSEEGVSRWLSIINHWQSHRRSRRAILVGVTISNKCPKMSPLSGQNVCVPGDVPGDTPR